MEIRLNDKKFVIIVCLLFIPLLVWATWRILDTYMVEETEPNNIVDATSESVAYIDLIDMTTPEYQLVMTEKPTETMAEFFTGVDRTNRITIAYLHVCGVNSNVMTRTTYLIDMFMQESNISDEKYYFIEIDTGVADGMSEDSIIVQVNNTTVDDTWNVIENAINEYNENAHKRNNGEIEYDKDTWVNVFEMIEAQLAENDIPITKKVDDVLIIDP